MRYHLDTIPVWDAYKETGSECPLCDLKKKSEAAYVESFLGASVMEPAVRVEVNEKGFCADHFAQMFREKNRLGLALMTHTHLKQVLADRQPYAAEKRKLFAKKPSPQAEHDASCILCERLANTMDRYLYTVLHLWKSDSEFKNAFQHSKGLCLPHADAIARMAPDAIGHSAEAFLHALEQLQSENLARLEKELEWFTLKFDYRNAEAPWGNSRDALERTINKLRGRCL